MLAETSSEILDWWMEAGLSGGDWRTPLDLTAQKLRAAGVVMICQDHVANRSTASVGSDSSIDFVLRCRELARTRFCEPQQCHALHLGYISWASADTGPADGHSTVTMFALHSERTEVAVMQPLATIAACSMSAKARLEAIQAASAFRTTAFDWLPFGVVIVDEALRASEMNEVCGGLVARADGLGQVGNRLTCRDRGDQAALSGAVSAALNSRGISPLVRIARSGGAEPYLVRAICAGRNEENAPQCLLVIADPKAGPPLASDVWRAMFDLTEGELTIAERIVARRKISGVA